MGARTAQSNDARSLYAHGCSLPNSRMTRAACPRMAAEPGVAAAAALQAHALRSTTPYVRLRARRDGGEFIFPAQVRPRAACDEECLRATLSCCCQLPFLQAHAQPSGRECASLMCVTCQVTTLSHTYTHAHIHAQTHTKQLLSDLSSTAKGMLSTSAFSEVYASVSLCVL